MKNLPVLTLVIICCLFGTVMQGQDQLPYQMPPANIADLADAAPTPGVSISPDHQWIVLLQYPSYPPIAEVSQPELRIGGLRINPRNNGRSRASFLAGMRLKSVADGQEFEFEGLPEVPRIETISWSPQGDKIAFMHNTGTGLELWVAEIASRRAKKLTEGILNAAIPGSPFNWLNNEQLICKTIPSDRGTKPEPSPVPRGPVIRENKGKEAAARTYQDLLKNPHDETLFAYYTQSQLMRIGVDGTQAKLGEPSILYEASPSPDGNYLLVESLERPFSYIVPYYRFPVNIQIWTKDGQVHKTLAQIPAAEEIPIGFGAVRTGPRSHTWRADAPASVYWVEALDGGDPSEEVAYRDELFHLDAPFAGEPVADLKTTLRYSGVRWGNGELAIVRERWWKDRHEIQTRFAPENPAAGMKVIFDRNWEDRYHAPGNFQSTRNAFGRYVLLTDKKGETLYLTGTGASPEGNRPFVDSYDLASGETKRWWRSEAPYYEYPVEIIDIKKQVVLTRRESKDEPANYCIRNMKKGTFAVLTDFQHPFPQFKDVKKELIRYEREDGVQLSGTLYLPPGYEQERDGRLPVLMWAYPEEFKSAAAAGQVSGSPYRFIRMRGSTPLYWLAQGYAILDDPGMPIIGEGEEEPNDSFVEQLVANAAAAIDYLEERGIADRERVAIGGHSYGAFMTANLLAHSDLFACGIARSGAYNRTLTPFGFQREERTFWEAPEIYFQMSPFMHAEKVNEPILLIHGEADNNSGTYPMQSERFYTALKGHGAQVRLVMLPAESHGYRSRESIMHVLWEMDRFLEMYIGKGMNARKGK